MTFDVSWPFSTRQTGTGSTGVDPLSGDTSCWKARRRRDPGSGRTGGKERRDEAGLRRSSFIPSSWWTTARKKPSDDDAPPSILLLGRAGGNHQIPLGHIQGRSFDQSLLRQETSRSFSRSIDILEVVSTASLPVLAQLYRSESTFPSFLLLDVAVG